MTTRYKIKNWDWQNKEYCVVMVTKHVTDVIYVGTWQDCVNRLRQVW